MSLVKLLTQYPNYSARRVRRLAIQLAYLENINSKEAKGIADDLMEFNLLQAKVESQMNDDVRVEAVQDPNRVTERVCVTPLDQAIRAIQVMEELEGIIDEDGSAHKAAGHQARGIVNGQSFYTDHTYIQEKGDGPPPLVLSSHSG